MACCLPHAPRGARVGSGRSYPFAMDAPTVCRQTETDFETSSDPPRTAISISPAHLSRICPTPSRNHLDPPQLPAIHSLTHRCPASRCRLSCHSIAISYPGTSSGASTTLNPGAPRSLTRPKLCASSGASVPKVTFSPVGLDIAMACRLRAGRRSCPAFRANRCRT